MKNDRIENTDYPHIVKTENICGGEPLIDETRITVRHIVGYYYKAGMTVEGILAEWDYLKPSQVFSALAYYHDHEDEINALIDKNSYAFRRENDIHAVA